MRCACCGGTGQDPRKTEVLRRLTGDHHVYARCWACNGNGIAPAYPDYSAHQRAGCTTKTNSRSSYESA